ncbi:MAG: hypothetical protein M1812_005960 [Candelaria pacifica]|nr:MAG: hypothetical protein M1812_005960 [Candelaria pacifica]
MFTTTTTTTFLTTTLLLATTLATVITPTPTPLLTEGINCKGNTLCAFHGVGLGQSAASWFYARLAGGIDSSGTEFPGISDSIMYPPGYQIGCGWIFLGSALCLFTQSTNFSWSAGHLKLVLGDLDFHRCWTCGSAPLDREVNDVGRGMLTINVTKNPRCVGICPLPAVREEVATA